MEYVVLNNGIKMPVVGFGVFQINDKDICINSVLDAIDVGYRLIDTAQAYGNEEAVGIAIKKSKVSREELFITTKVWISNAGYEKAKQSIEESLKKMQLDYLDLFLIHQPLNDYYGTYHAMEQMYREGKIRAIGVSNFYPDRLVDLSLFNEIKPAVNQVEVNIYNQQIDAQNTMNKYNIQMQAWAPFAEGKNRMFDTRELKDIGSKYEKSVAQVILRWLVQRGIVPLAKSTHKDRIKENLDIFDFTLTEEEMKKISELDKKESSFFSHHNPDIIEYLANLVR